MNMVIKNSRRVGMNKKIVSLILCSALFLSGCSSSKQTAVVYNGGSMVQYYFTKANEHPEKALINVINATRNNLDLAIYDITQEDIVKAVLSAEKRGVKVRLITDKVESNSKSESGVLQIFKENGIPVKVNSHSGLMHLKVTIADEKIVTTGSYNYTAQASTKNDEVLVLISDSNSAMDFEDQFEKMWDNNSDFQDY
jgi:phosphatidylserine/phosphatidylglycerophosphate/cardiolipin synthase-like enzyme